MKFDDESLNRAKRAVATGYDYFWNKRPGLSKPSVSTRLLEFRSEEATRFLDLSADGSCLLLDNNNLHLA